MSKTINPKIKWREWAPNFYPVKRLFTSDRKRLIKKILKETMKIKFAKGGQQ